MSQASNRPQARRARPEIHRAIAALQRLSFGFAKRRRQLAAEQGLTEAQWRLLEEVAGEDFMPSMFARRRDCSAAAVSRGLRSLLDEGLVAASIAEKDGRQRLYRLTRAGRNRLLRLRRRRERAIAAVWNDFDADELDAFVRFASALSESLESYAAQDST